VTGTEHKPIIGISCGDINGIGIEVIIKTIADARLLDLCTPVIFASNKVINFYRKFSPGLNFSFGIIKEFNKLEPKHLNIYNCWEDDVVVTPGVMNETGGTYGIKSLMSACNALKDGKINGLVTAPIHKKNIQSDNFKYTGHTPFLKDFFNSPDVLMILAADNLRVGLVTEHLPIKEVAEHITKEAILSKLKIFHASLQKDFGIDRPRIAVLGLNPHAGDEGLVGSEEEKFIKPAVKEAKQNNMLVIGPFSADAFFARGNHEKFDGVLAMYHDQGLIPFKSLSIGEGVNFTAGLPVIRTSPDHGTAFDIAGQNKADESSFRGALFTCLDIISQRRTYNENRSNPMKKMGAAIVASGVDEKIVEDAE
jgi:4-hydroxythreonine-4-phosphate dehydrogenase